MCVLYRTLHYFGDAFRFLNTFSVWLIPLHDVLLTSFSFTTVLFSPFQRFFFTSGIAELIPNILWVIFLSCVLLTLSTTLADVLQFICLLFLSLPLYLPLYEYYFTRHLTMISLLRSSSINNFELLSFCYMPLLCPMC